MSDAEIPMRKGRTFTVRAVMALAGGVVGMGLGWAVGRLVRSGVLDDSRWTWSDFAAMTIAAMLLATGVLILGLSLNGRGLGLALDPASERVPKAPQVRFARLQGAVMALAGVMLLIPTAAQTFAVDQDPSAARIVFGGLIALFLLQTWANITVWMRGDELMRVLIAESGAACFWVLQAALFLWAAAEKLNLVPALSAWDLTAVMMGAYLAISSIAAMRRGFA